MRQQYSAICENDQVASGSHLLRCRAHRPPLFGGSWMSFAPRRATRSLAALVAIVVLMVPLAVAGTALASTSTITQQDCDQGTIKDKSGNTIPKARCERLVGKQVQLAGTGFEVWIVAAAGVACLAGAAFFGLRRTRPVRAV